MTARLRNRVRLESALALVSLVLTGVTAISAEWIEELTGFEPDGGSGALEWAIVVAFGAAAIGLGLLARRDRQRLRLLLS